jgi:hypothetical protein
VRDNSFCFIMARKTASLQKRLKKSSKKRSAATTAERASSTTESDKIKTGYKDTPVKSGSVEASTMQQHNLHPDGCNCFLRRGQMFLPSSLLEGNDSTHGKV